MWRLVACCPFCPQPESAAYGLVLGSCSQSGLRFPFVRDRTACHSFQVICVHRLTLHVTCVLLSCWPNVSAAIHLKCAKLSELVRLVFSCLVVMSSESQQAFKLMVTQPGVPEDVRTRLAGAGIDTMA
eukprot:3391622-Amphidinium_carterae.1